MIKSDALPQVSHDRQCAVLVSAGSNSIGDFNYSTMIPVQQKTECMITTGEKRKVLSIMAIQWVK